MATGTQLRQSVASQALRTPQPGNLSAAKNRLLFASGSIFPLLLTDILFDVRLVFPALVTGAPTVSTLTIGQNYQLAPNSLVTGAPTVKNLQIAGPITQNYNITLRVRPL